MPNSVRIGELLEVTRLEIVHDYENTAYRIRLPSKVPLLLPAEAMHEATDEQWREFMLELKSIFEEG